MRAGLLGAQVDRQNAAALLAGAQALLDCDEMDSDRFDVVLRFDRSDPSALWSFANSSTPAVGRLRHCDELGAGFQCGAVANAKITNTRGWREGR